MLKAGDICPSCRPMWDTQKLTPKKMVCLRDKDGQEVYTVHNKLPVVVCTWCDGDFQPNLR